MKDWFRVSVMLVALVALGCGDDRTSSKVDAGDPFDVGEGPVDSGADVAEPGPDMGEDAGDRVDMAEPVKDLGSDDGTGDAATDAGVDMPPPEPPIDVTWPTTPTEYAATTTVTYVSSLQLPDIGGDDDRPLCCRDFGAISRDEGVDNSLAILRSTIAGFDYDLNDLLRNTIESGDLVVLLDHRELDGPDDPDNFALAWLRGVFEGGTSFAQASAGNGTYLLDPDSLTATGEPRLLFNPATMRGGEMAAGPARLNLLLPIAFTTLDVTVEDASISGTASIQTDGVAYTGGEISGWVEIEEIFGNVNRIVAAQCECLGLGNTPLFEQDADGDWRANCVDDVPLLCADDLCHTLAGKDINDGGTCNLARQVLPALADIDTDGDRSRFEAISIGLEWTGVTGEVVGVE